MGIGTALSIGSVLAKLGQGYFAGRDMRNDQREQDRRVGYSNLINTLGGSSTPSPVQPNPGKAATILGGIGTALGTGANISNMIDAKKMADLQLQNVQAQMDSRALADDISRGTTMGAGSILPQTSISAAPKLAVPEPPPMMPVAPQLAAAAPPPVMPKLAGAAPPPMSADDLSTLASMPSELFPETKLAAMPSELFPASREADTLSALSSMPSELFPETKLAAMPSELFPASREANAQAAVAKALEEAAMPIAPISEAPLSDLTGPSGAGSRMAPGSVELGGSVAPGSLSDVGKAAFSAAQNEQIAARAAAEVAAEQAAAAQQLNDARMQQIVAQTGKITKESEALARPGWTFEESIDRATPTVTSLAQTNTPWSKIATSPSFSQVDPTALDALRATYDAEAAKVMGETNKGVSDFLYGDVRQLANGNAMIKKSSDLQFGANLLVTGYGQDNGAGDLQMVTASVRLGDPGMGVRPAEAAQWEESGGMVQGWLVFGEKFKEGDRFTPEVRNKLLKAGLDQYEGQTGLVDKAVGNLQSAAADRIFQMTGSEDISAVPGVSKFFDNYRLPPLEAYANLSPETLKLYRTMGPVPFNPSGTGGVDMEALRNYKPGGEVGGNILSVLGNAFPETGAMRGVYK